jgi:hypothetical protein
VSPEYFVEVAIADGDGHYLPDAASAAGVGDDADSEDDGGDEQQQQQEGADEEGEERGARVGRQRGTGYFLLHVDTGSAVMALPSRICTGCCAHSLRYRLFAARSCVVRVV